MRTRIGNDIINDISSSIDERDILHACDSVGISWRAYYAIFNVLKDATKSKGYKKCLLPNPNKLRL
eukprot:c5226_g1_i1 orf=149-346(+)